MGKGGGTNATHLATYLKGVEDFHQAGVLGGVVLLEVVVFLPWVLGGGLLLCQDAVLDAGQAPRAVGIGQVLPGSGQDPAATELRVTPQLSAWRGPLGVLGLLLIQPQETVTKRADLGSVS